jgi:hypothetical protein
MEITKQTETFEPLPINEFEIDMLKGTKSSSELLAEEQEEQILMANEDELKKQKHKDIILMMKVIILNRMGMFPLMNPSDLSAPQQKEFICKIYKRCYF